MLVSDPNLRKDIRLQKQSDAGDTSHWESRLGSTVHMILLDVRRERDIMQ